MYCMSSSRSLARNPLDILLEKEEREEGRSTPKKYVGIEQGTNRIIVMGTQPAMKNTVNKRVRQIKMIDNLILIKKD